MNYKFLNYICFKCDEKFKWIHPPRIRLIRPNGICDECGERKAVYFLRKSKAISEVNKKPEAKEGK